MYSDTGDTTSLVPGFPIRTSSDQRSVDSSPRHIAASHVLHRLLMPRHPPCALKHLQHKKTTRTKTADKNQQILLRCSQPLSNKQTPHPTTKMKRHHHPDPRPGQHGVVSGPNSVFSNPAAPIDHTHRCDPHGRFVVAHQAGTHYRCPTPHGPSKTSRLTLFVVLLRKEVIQPHLPVRLPCYDFVPIADPTFDSSPHKG